MAEKLGPQEKRPVDSVTGASGGGTSSVTGASGPSDQGSSATPDTDKKPTAGESQTADRHARGNLGGRDPRQPGTAAGERDSSQNRGDMEMVDPMTSRAPNKVNQNKDQKESQ